MSAICGPAMRVISEQDAGVRWCFRCRQRVPFVDRLWVTAEAPHWGPYLDRTCLSGHTDGDVGCDHYRDWEVPW